MSLALRNVQAERTRKHLSTYAHIAVAKKLAFKERLRGGVTIVASAFVPRIAWATATDARADVCKKSRRVVSMYSLQIQSGNAATLSMTLAYASRVLPACHHQQVFAREYNLLPLIQRFT